MPRPTHPHHRVSRTAAALLAAALGAAGVSLHSTTALAAPPTAARTAQPTADQRLVDAVPTPKLAWYSCYDYAQCTTVAVPLDYDDPTGPTTEIAVLRVKATDRRHRIGSLFLNPGGPGGSGTEMAYFASEFLPRSLTRRFDVVGFDPRGTNFSDNVVCFANIGAQEKVLHTFYNLAFPQTSGEVTRYIRQSENFGKACSASTDPLVGSMSTAQAARDMDLLRRAIGDEALSYLGFSYGSYLGTVYANMFPRRVRAVAIDGVLDPKAWAGRPGTADRPQTDRLRSADGSWKALRELLHRCNTAGTRTCSFAGGTPMNKFKKIAHRLKTDPHVPGWGTVTYRDFMSLTLSFLYDAYSAEYLPDLYQDLYTSMNTRVAAPRQVSAGAAAAALVAKRRAEIVAQHPFGFPYDNALEAFETVLCTDSLNPARASDWKAAMRTAGTRAPYFAKIWGWQSAPCARSTWTVTDDDAFRGSFRHWTSRPVLVIGNTYDPATNYRGAVVASTLLPNSRLLSSDSWGHTAFGTSRCVTNAVVRYLVDVHVPRYGARCTGDYQPFEGGRARLAALKARAATPGVGSPAPVTPPLGALAGLSIQ